MPHGGIMTQRRGRGKTRRAPRQPIEITPYLDAARAITQRFRLRLGWSKKDTGDACGLSSSMLTQWEKGQVDLSIRSLLRLCLTVGVPVEQIFAPTATGVTQALIERIVLLNPNEQAVLLPMVDVLLTAQLAAEAAKSAQQENCA